MKVFALVVVLLHSLGLFAVGNDVAMAMRRGADVRLELHVVDDLGNAVPQAEVYGGFAMGGGLNDGVTISGRTDDNGVFVVKGRCKLFVQLQVFKEGFYRWSRKFDYAGSPKGASVVDGKWQPYGEVVVVVLDRKKNPISMPGVYGRPEIKIPAFDQWLDFDLENGSWLPPFGKGRFSDVQLKFSHVVRTNKYFDFKATMEVSFTNNLYAGAYVMKRRSYSTLPTVYEADTNQTYLTSFKFEVDINRQNRRQCLLGDDEYMVFRTRTTVDDEGRLISAHYGKILGRWGFSKIMAADQMCINPKPNDLNIEDRALADSDDRDIRQTREILGKGLLK